MKSLIWEQVANILVINFPSISPVISSERFKLYQILTVIKGRGNREGKLKNKGTTHFCIEVQRKNREKEIEDNLSEDRMQPDKDEEQSTGYLREGST